MKYFTEPVHHELAIKLHEKGMEFKELFKVEPGMTFLTVEIVSSDYNPLDDLSYPSVHLEKRYIIPTYAEVFDWLMNKGVHVVISDGIVDGGKTAYLGKSARYSVELTPLCDTWQEAADKAIEKTLEMI